MLHYDLLRQLAQKIQRPVKDLIALAPANDPYYAGCPYRERDGTWFGALWDRFEFPHGVHLRRIHYQLVSMSEESGPVLKPDGEPYLNTQNDWALLGRAALAARYLDIVPTAAFVDRRNDEPRIFTPQRSYGKPSIRLAFAAAYLADRVEDFPDLPSLTVENFEAEQDYIVEVWIEKSTLNDWLVPLCEIHRVNLVVGVGELSEVACRLLVERVQETGKPARILYISDFDPAGRSMPVAVARKIEFHAYKVELKTDITLRPIILTEDQCRQYRLPRTPIKETERRKSRFEQHFGIGATELDALEALHPGEMQKIVNSEISRYIDPTLDNRVRIAESRLGSDLRKVEEKATEPYREEIEDLKGEYSDIIAQLQEWESGADELWAKISDGMEPMAPDIDDYEIPKARPANDPDGFLLFDSKRDYLSQLDHYHEWQRRAHDGGVVEGLEQ